MAKEERIDRNRFFKTQEERESFEREYGEVSKQGQPVNLKNLQEIEEIKNLFTAIEGKKANKKRRKTIKEIGKTHDRAVEAGKSVGFFAESKRTDIDKLATNAIDMFDKNIVAQKYLDTAGEKLKKPISNSLIKDVSKMIWNLLADNGGSAKVAKYFKDKGKLTPLACIPDRFGKKVYDLVEKAYNEQSKKEENPSFSMKAINVKELNDEFFSFNPNDISKDINKIINKTDKNQAIVEKELREPESKRYEAEKKAHEALGALLEEVVISKSGNDNVKKLKNAFTRTDDWKTVAGIIDSFSSGRESIVDPELAVIKLVHYLNNQVVNDDYDRIVEELTNELGVKVNEQGTDVEVNINFESLNSYQKYMDAKRDYEEKQRAYDDKVAEVAGRVKEFNEGEIYNLEYQLAMENLAPIDRDIDELLSEMSDYLTKDANGVVSANVLDEPEISKESIVSDFDDKKLRENNQKLNAETKKLQAYNLLSVTDHNKLAQEALKRYESLVQMREDAISAIANGISNAYSKNLDAARYGEIEKRISDYANNPIYQNISKQKQKVNENEETNNLEEIRDENYEALNIPKDATMDALSSLYERSAREFASLTPEEQAANVNLQEKMQGFRNQIAHHILEKEIEKNYPQGFDNLTEAQKGSARGTFKKVVEFAREANENVEKGENGIFYKVSQVTEGNTFEEKTNLLLQRNEITPEEFAKLRVAQHLFVQDTATNKALLADELYKVDENGNKVLDEDKALSRVAEATVRMQSEKKAYDLCSAIENNIQQNLALQNREQEEQQNEDEAEENLELLANVALVKFSPKYSSSAGAAKALKELAALYAGIPAEFTPNAPQSDYQPSNEEIKDFILDIPVEELETQTPPTPPTQTPRILEVPYMLKTDKSYNQPHPSEMGPFLPRTWYLGTYGQRDKLVDDLIKQNAETLNTLKSLVEKVGTQQTTQSVDINKLVEKLVDGNTASVEKISEAITKAFDALNGEIKEIKTISGKGGVTYVFEGNKDCAINLGKGGNVKLVTNNYSNQNATNKTYTQTNNDYSISNYQTFEEITQKFVESGAPLPPNYVEKYTEIIKETEKTSEKITTEKILEKLIKEINNTSEGREGESGKGDTYVISGDTIIYNDNSKTNSDNVNNTTNNTIDPETAKENTKNICAILEQINETNQNTNNVIQSLNQAIVKGSKIDQTFLNKNNIDIDIKEARGKVEEKGNITTVPTPSGELVKIVINNNQTQRTGDTSVNIDGLTNGGNGRNKGGEEPKPTPGKNTNDPKTQKPSKKLEDLGKEAFDVMDDLWFEVRHQHALHWKESVEKKIGDLQKINPNDKEIEKLKEELDEAKKFVKVSENAAHESDPKKRNDERERLMSKIAKDFDATKESWHVTDFEYDPTSKGAENAMLEQHMSTEENMLLYIGNMVDANPGLIKIYNQKGLNGNLNGLERIIKVLNDYEHPEYGKLGDRFKEICKGAGGLEVNYADLQKYNEQNKFVQDAQNAFGKNGEGYFKKETNTNIYHNQGGEGKQA